MNDEINKLNDVLGMDSSEDTQAYFQEKLRNVEQRLSAFTGDTDSPEYAGLLLEQAQSLQGLERKADMWAPARTALDIFLAGEHWSEAVDACDLLYNAEQPESIKALAHGVWLSVTFPVAPDQSVTLLNDLINEMPAKSDGRAVAAATAHYIVSLRASDDDFDNLNFMTTNLIAEVAKGHSQADSQELLDFWMERMGLKEPAKFLPRLAQVLDAVVPAGEWWFDKESLRARIPH